MVVFADHEVLDHAVLVDAAKEGVIFSFGVVARLGVVDAADGVAGTVEGAVEAIGYLCYLCVAVLADGGELHRRFGRAPKVDVVLQNKILACAFVVGVTVFCHGVKVIGGVDAVGVSLCAFACETPCCCCALGLCRGCDRCYASDDKSKNFFHIRCLFCLCFV